MIVARNVKHDIDLRSNDGIYMLKLRMFEMNYS